MTELFFTLLGLLGACCVLSMYFLNSQAKISAQSVKYLIINAFGAFLILVSALASYDGGDFGTVLVEGVWVLVSIIGIVQLRKRSV